MKKSREIILIAHNLRSIHNVGSLLRTAEGLSVSKVILSGYTPYPSAKGDVRLPHESSKIHKQIQKTALGAEELVNWAHADDIMPAIQDLKADGFQIYAVEQAEGSISLAEFSAPDKLALLVGREVEGVEPEVLGACDGALEIPMSGQKESFNVVQAAAMVLYHCTFM